MRTQVLDTRESLLALCAVELLAVDMRIGRPVSGLLSMRRLGARRCTKPEPSFGRASKKNVGAKMS
jgi:hypothetical protein